MTYPNANVSQSQYVHQMFEDQVARTPGAVAVVFKNEQMTYAELKHWELARMCPSGSASNVRSKW